MLRKTVLIKKTDVRRSWHCIDASGEVLGRVATRAAGLLRGKGKRTFSPHLDNGDFVIITNAAKVRLTGKKLKQKFYFSYSGYPGGITQIPYEQFLKNQPEKAVTEAVKGMLPRNRTRKKLLTRLRIFKGAEHTHLAQMREGQGIKKSQKKEPANQVTVDHTMSPTTSSA